MASGVGPRPLNPGPSQIDGLGLGCAPIGDLFTAVTDDDATATVRAALDAGVAFFDTAPHYGAGLSERRLGVALQGVERDAVAVATKVGRRILDADGIVVGPGIGVRTEPDLSADGVMRSLEASLARMGLDRVDVLYLHDPDDEDRALAETLPAMAQLRAEGVVGMIGVGMNFSAPLTRFAREFELDVVMVAGRYTLLDRSAAEDLLPVAVARGTHVVAAGVFNTGILVDPRPGAPYDYRPAPAELLARAQRMQRTAEAAGVPLSTAAVQFPLRHRAVGSVVVGARTPDEVRSFVDDARRPVPPELWGRL